VLIEVFAVPDAEREWEFGGRSLESLPNVTPVGATHHREEASQMPHLLPRSTAAPDVGSAPSAVGSKQHRPTPVLVTEQEVVFSTAAAIPVLPATTRRHQTGARLIAAIGRIHIAQPEPRPHYLRRERNYFEAARMSRAMDHL
jgi:hypothetical protein